MEADQTFCPSFAKPSGHPCSRQLVNYQLNNMHIFHPAFIVGLVNSFIKLNIEASVGVSELINNQRSEKQGTSYLVLIRVLCFFGYVCLFLISIHSLTEEPRDDTIYSSK